MKIAVKVPRSRSDAWGDDAGDFGALEELETKAKTSSYKMGSWDMFKVNAEKFGVKSTFKTDMSQYTTPLNVKKLSAEQVRYSPHFLQCQVCVPRVDCFIHILTLSTK